MRRRAGFFSKSDIKKNYTIGDQRVSGNFAVVRKGPKTPNTETRAPTRVCDGAGQISGLLPPVPPPRL